MKLSRSGSPLFLAASLFLLGPSPRPATAQLLGPEFHVNSYTTNVQRYPAVAASGSGSFVVVWGSYGQDGYGWGVFGQRFNSMGDPVGSEFQVNTYTTLHQDEPAVAADGSGNFVVVWDSSYQAGSFNSVFGQRHDSTGSQVGSEFQVNTYTSGILYAPAVAADGSGNFVVVWSSIFQDGSDFGVFGQRFNLAGVRLGSEFRVNSYTTGSQSLPAVAANGSGSFVVVWPGAGLGDVNGVFGQQFNSAGIKVGGEFLVNTYTTNEQGYPAVSTDGSGNFAVVWESNNQDGSNTGVFGQRFNSAGSAVGSEFRVNTTTASDQRNPAVSADGLGNFVVVWESLGQDGSLYGVFGQLYDSAGLALGSELRVNNYTLDYQRNPAVAADGSGKFVVVWRSNYQDGDLDGVFGQRMTTTVFDHGFEANPPFWSDNTATMCSGFCIPDGTPNGVCFCDNPCLTFGNCCLDACSTCGQCVP